jgi:hypothetical protein
MNEGSCAFRGGLTLVGWLIAIGGAGGTGGAKGGGDGVLNTVVPLHVASVPNLLLEYGDGVVV